MSSVLLLATLFFLYDISARGRPSIPNQSLLFIAPAVASRIGCFGSEFLIVFFSFVSFGEIFKVGQVRDCTRSYSFPRRRKGYHLILFIYLDIMDAQAVKLRSSPYCTFHPCCDMLYKLSGVNTSTESQ